MINTPYRTKIVISRIPYLCITLFIRKQVNISQKEMAEENRGDFEKLFQTKPLWTGNP